ncbi:hypothetical protein XELAEV_18012462mg [Xenopus laevis]|uniref:Uncharacterized protein n=1 Tax=Xenopus laevis TaxID=8355 RepID=A0A974HY50_XENLA|nr:hypothetical protein XELAEV_18012462mg [Xenopus laevis]
MAAIDINAVTEHTSYIGVHTHVQMHIVSGCRHMHVGNMGPAWYRCVGSGHNRTRSQPSLHGSSLSASLYKKSILMAPSGHVTYFHFCKPIRPELRRDCIGRRTQWPHQDLSKEELESSFHEEHHQLVVHGVSCGQTNQKLPQQAAERMQLHVYLPCGQQTGRNTAEFKSEVEESSFQFSSLRLQEDEGCGSAQSVLK